MAIFVPAEPFHPGEYLVDELKARNWTQEDLAAITAISRRQIINLTQGKSGITPETALALAEAFGDGQDAMGWMKLQAAYELALEAQKQRSIERETARRARLYVRFPVREIVRRGWVDETHDIAALERSICDLCRISDVDAHHTTLQVAARKSTDYATDTGAQWAWYGRAFDLAHYAPASEYHPEAFEDGVAELLKLAAFAEDARRVPKLLGDMGVRLVLIDRLQKSKVDGVAFWLDEERQSKPAIALSLRYDRIDNFWFTLLHELVHIKYRDATVIDVDLMNTETSSDLPECEQRANREAANYLIADEKLNSFIRRCKPLYYQSKIIQFAQANGVHPGIVVGQLQRVPNSGFEYKQLRKQLVKIREFLLGNAITDGWKNRPSV